MADPLGGAREYSDEETKQDNHEKQQQKNP